MTSQQELQLMAEMVEAKDFANDFVELVELANYTALANPISETAEHIKEELFSALKELR